MKFQLLGPVKVWHRSVNVPVTAPMQRAVLASLLTRLETVTSVETIVEDLWGSSPPRTAIATVRNYIRRLRKVFPVPVLQSKPAGYQLAIEPQHVDTHQFTTLVDQARQRGSGELFDRALSLWRGDPLMDIGNVPLRMIQGPRWEEAYLTAQEDALDLRLGRGQHAAMLARLTELTARYPLRERLCRQLMVALYRSGRAAEALAHYHHTRRRLVNDLGMEPGPDLRRLAEAILREDAEFLASVVSTGHVDQLPARTRTPDQVPAPPTPLVGREDQVRELMGWFATAGDAPVHCFVYGPGGSGKSALAIHVGHELARRFVDGLHYVDLRGSTPGVPSRSPVEVLTALLSGLGGAEVGQPGDLTALVDAYRTRLHGRRVLVILDNAAYADQVLAALPDEPGCAAIVTSRAAVAGGGNILHLDPLRQVHAVELLSRIAGGRKVRDEPAAAARLADLCGGLPLAVRSIATRAALRPHWPLETWVTVLDDEHTRLDQLRHEDVDVRASLLVGLDDLRAGGDSAGRDAVTLFPLLGVLNCGYVTAALAAGLTGWPVARAERALESLTDVRLLYSPGPGRYVRYDLVAILAREQAAQLPAARRRERLRAAVDWYIAAVRCCSLAATGSRTEPGLPQQHPVDAVETVEFDRYDQAREWLDRELTVLVTLLRRAAEAGVPGSAEAARVVLQTLPFYLNSALPWTERTALASILLENSPDTATAFSYTQLAIVEAQRGHMAVAQRLLDKAGVALDDDDLYTHLLFTSTQGIVTFYQGDAPGALDRFEWVLRVAADGDYRTFEARALNNIAAVYLRTGRAADAIPLLERALVINREIGNELSIAVNLNTILQAYSALGDHVDVVLRAAEVLVQHEPLGDAHQRAEHMLTTAKSLRALGRHAAADEHCASARECLAVIGSRERVQPSTLFARLVTDIP